MKLGWSLLALGCSTFAACHAAPGRAEYSIVNSLEIRVPEGAREVRVWLALPQETASQKVSGLAVECAYPSRITKDSALNDVLFVEARDPAAGLFSLTTTFELSRVEERHDQDPDGTRPLNDAERKQYAKELSGNANVVITQEVRDLAARILDGERSPLKAARKLYDWTLDNVDSWVKSPATSSASSMGSSEHCLARKTGDAVDFHSLYAALARSAGIPTRILYGSLLAQGAAGTDVDRSGACWVEIFAPDQGWIPVDVAEADIFVGDFALTSENEPLVRAATAAAYHGPDLEKVRYYFGNIEERRVLWSIGRDLELEPRTASGAVNALPKAYVEIDGRKALETTAWKRTLTFTQL